MTDPDTERRLTELRTTPLFSDPAVFSDDYLISTLTSSVKKWLNLTHQPADVGAEIDDMIIELAKIKLGREGVEGTSGSSEGGVSRNWDVLPIDLSNAINGYRLVMGL